MGYRMLLKHLLMPYILDEHFNMNQIKEKYLLCVFSQIDRESRYFSLQSQHSGLEELAYRDRDLVILLINSKLSLLMHTYVKPDFILMVLGLLLISLS